MSDKKISIIGMASCYGAQDMRCAEAPRILQELKLNEFLSNQSTRAEWLKNIYPDHFPVNKVDKLSVIVDLCKQLVKQTRHAINQHNQIIVLGGDHSCAIGTWSGAYQAIQQQGELGLIWIDAHMDSHTPETSPSGAIHGMPLACLLGYGDNQLTEIAGKSPILKPENVCLIGIRSYETGEAELLSRLGVKIFYMEDIKQLGMEQVMRLAQAHVIRNSVAYGISLDLDAIDPRDAPGVGSPEKNGISAQQLIRSLKNLTLNENFIGMEIAELNYEQDDDDKTAMLAIKILKATFK